MLTKFVPIVFKRQKEMLPLAINQLESFGELNRLEIMMLADGVAKSLRSQLLILSLITADGSYLEILNKTGYKGDKDLFPNWDGSDYPRYH